MNSKIVLQAIELALSADYNVIMSDSGLSIYHSLPESRWICYIHFYEQRQVIEVSSCPVTHTEFDMYDPLLIDNIIDTVKSYWGLLDD